MYLELRTTPKVVVCLIVLAFFTWITFDLDLKSCG